MGEGKEELGVLYKCDSVEECRPLFLLLTLLGFLKVISCWVITVPNSTRHIVSDQSIFADRMDE